MTHREDGGIDSDPQPSAELISLCDHRRRRHHHRALHRLVDTLDAMHRRAITLHNRAIEQADLSVFTELCKTLGLSSHALPCPYRAALAIPAALYGRSQDAIFGQRPLQEQLEQELDDPKLFRALRHARLAIYDYQPGDDGAKAGRLSPHLASPFDEPIDGVTLICQAGQCAQQEGLYSGWLIEHRDQPYLAFAHRLDNAQRQALRVLSTDHGDDPDDLHLPLLRALLSPDAPAIETAGGARPACRPPATRPGLRLAMHRAIWRRFAEPKDGLTIHAHIALLIDDAPAFQAFLDEIDHIRRSTTLRFGGAPPDADPITLDELLAPYHVDARGELRFRQPLWPRPLAPLQLDDDLLDRLPFDRRNSIGEAIQWARSHPDTPLSRRVEVAFSNLRMEANLLATYGLHASANADPGDAPPPVVGHLSPVLPNLRVLFAPSFINTRLTDLPLSPELRDALHRCPQSDRSSPADLRLADLHGDERDLFRHHGLSPHYFPELRRTLLHYAARWRHPLLPTVDPLP